MIKAIPPRIYVQYLIEGIPKPLVSYGHFNVVEYLVAEALVPTGICDGQDLIEAASYGRFNVVKYLLNCGGFDVNQFDTAITEARNRGDTQIMAMLEQYKAGIPSLK